MGIPCSQAIWGSHLAQRNALACKRHCTAEQRQVLACAALVRGRRMAGYPAREYLESCLPVSMLKLGLNVCQGAATTLQHVLELYSCVERVRE